MQWERLLPVSPVAAATDGSSENQDEMTLQREPASAKKAYDMMYML